MNDLKFAFRQLLKNPGFTAVAVLTLAIGIGAITSLFTGLDTIMLRPLPVPEASRLIYVASGGNENFSFPFYERLGNTTAAFSGFAGVQYGAARRELIATGAGATEAESVRAQAVTGSFFALLGVPALLGRTLSVDDDRPGVARPVVVISHAFWQRRFASDAAVLGKMVTLDNVAATIVGVMPAGFVGFEIGANPDVWWPIQLVTQFEFETRDRNRLAEGAEWLVLFGRLRSGVTRKQAQVEVSVIVRQQLEEQVAKSPNLTATERQRMLNQTIELHSGAAGYVGARSRFKQPLVVLKHQGTSGSGGARPRLQPALVVAQVALSVLLLAVAGLFVRTLHNLRSLDFGFQAGNLLSFSIDPGRWRPASPAQLNTLLQRVLNELETLPGVRSVSVAGAGMLSGNGYNTDFAVDGYSPAPGEEMRSAVVFAGPRFFKTLRVPLLRGREFNLADEPVPAPASAPRPATVATLGETMARRFFGDADPIGRHLTLTRGMLNGVRLEVIGVAKDTKYSRNLREKTPLEFYLPFFGDRARMPPTFYVRTEHSAAAIAADIRRVVTRIEPQVTIRNLRTMDEVVDRLLVRERIIAQLVGFFSVFALLLASLGLYGVLSYSVAQRTREIGMRMALGATLRDVVRLVIRQGLTLALFGCALGVGAALMVTKFIATLLYGVQPTDPFTFVGVTGLLMAVALTVCGLPARRAARVDPMEALRYE